MTPVSDFNFHIVYRQIMRIFPLRDLFFVSNFSSIQSLKNHNSEVECEDYLELFFFLFF